MTNINHPLTKLSAKQFEINVDVDQQHLLNKTLSSQKSFILLVGLLDHFCKLRHLLVLVLTDKDQKRCWLEFKRLTGHTIFFALNQSL